MVKRRKTNCLMLVSVVIGVSTSVSAMVQESSAPASPELRDFRLDPKPAEKPAEQPVGPPSDIPPPSKPTPAPPAAIPASRAAAVPQPSAPETRVERVQERKPAVERAVTNDKATQAVISETDKAAAKLEVSTTESLPSDVESTDIEVEPVITPKPEVVATPDLQMPAASNWWLGFGALGLFALLSGAWLVRRRRKAVAALDEPYNAVAESFDSSSTETVEPQTEAEADPAPLAAAAEVSQQPSIEAEFTPEQAQLSLANLTISGKLALRNAGKSALRNVTVRTTMISASEGQRDLIRQFHDDDRRGHAEPIGDARAGEEIALSLEIQQPRVELNEFDWRERRFMAPIVLIHISGRGAKGLEHHELSCLIGRESASETERMKPFHTDRGPRRFDGLGMRLVRI